MRHLGMIVGVLAGVAALALSLSGDARTVSAAADVTPKFEDTACPMKLPTGQLEQNVRCGYLTVAETRGSGDGRTDRLAVAILKSTSAHPKADPVVFVTGGPGAPALDGELQRLGEADAASFIQSERDFIFFDQRGTGHSEPGLFCTQDTRATYNETMLACHDRLIAAGVNLNSYNSVVTAHDIADLVRALGYGDYNLLGRSYGPRTILTAMRETPRHIRSVILDSPLPLQVNANLNDAADLQRSLREVFDDCAADAKCHAAYPRFEEQYWQDIARANEHPIDVEIRDAAGKPLAIKISGSALLSGTFSALYDTSVIRLLPFAADAIANGNNGVVAMLAQSLAFVGSDSADGMRMSVLCSEEIPFYTAELMRAANKGVRQEIIDAGVGTSTQAALDDALALCRAWGTPKPRPQENQAVVSGIPALVLDGQFDPATPPAYGKLAAEKLSHSYVFEFRSASHGVTDQQHDCASDMIKQFLARPASRPNSDCLASIKPLDFVIGEAPPPAPAEPQVAVSPAVQPPTGISAPNTGMGNTGVSRDLDARWALRLMVAGALLAMLGAANAVRSALRASGGRANR